MHLYIAEKALRLATQRTHGA